MMMRRLLMRIRMRRRVMGKISMGVFILVGKETVWSALGVWKNIGIAFLIYII